MVGIVQNPAKKLSRKILSSMSPDFSYFCQEPGERGRVSRKEILLIEVSGTFRSA